MNKRLVAIVAVLVLAGVGAASTFTVKQRQDTASLFAERYNIGELFVVNTTIGLAPIAANLDPTGGIPETAVEIASGNPALRTSLFQDHWSYSVVVQEIAQGSISTGVYVVELTLDGTPIASLYIKQATPEAFAVEGVRVTFDVGTTIASSALYYVVVRPYVPTLPITSITITSNPNDNNTWIFPGPPVVVSPDLTVELGTVLALTAVNGDGVAHTIGLKSGTTTIDPPGFSTVFSTTGDQRTISWTPSAAGTFTYVCGVHPDMKGNLRVVQPAA